MKKLNIVFYLLLAVVFTSCDTMEAENKYNKANWEHKTRMLDVEYLKKLNSVRSDAELKRAISYMDSLSSNYR
tara:strand:+ start:221 stop:439 length:219 start_codon:yes stop_codon:yes gene_type:complete